MSKLRSALAASALSFLTAGSVAAQAITAPATPAAAAPFDIVRTEIVSNGADVAFKVQVRGKAGELKPKATGQFAGSAVYSYVWPTSLDSATVGFDSAQGILALAVTFHPDFDDGAGGAVNRHVWHPHWVVLTKDPACGPAALKVKDIPEGAKPKLPATWPGVPLLIDSPTYPTTLATDTVEVKVPVSVIGATEGVKFDGVTSALKVNGNLHAPLLCVSDVFDVASGDLSLPGKVTSITKGAHAH
ncbi:hypothetical protein [Caulobacter sp.]|uniref:hypothetical protein n=1 Tax=Caulobacter sp. TaxID=78 RepID=UPI001B23D7D4|nr:hypothetical protein [Caulobacter sp.]MBO9544818.1 hypothetical protein [Caulobacter sp.]